jgi:hypothetical protein
MVNRKAKEKERESRKARARAIRVKDFLKEKGSLHPKVALQLGSHYFNRNPAR